jgi:hypothetical protein
LIHDKNKTARGGAKKVRKLRKSNSGSVNGTPAPKKTSLPIPVGSRLTTPSLEKEKKEAESGEWGGIFRTRSKKTEVA